MLAKAEVENREYVRVGQWQFCVLEMVSPDDGGWGIRRSWIPGYPTPGWRGGSISENYLLRQ